MRTLRRNRQKMWYSTRIGNEPLLDTDIDNNVEYLSYVDEDGNKVFILDDEGNRIPRDTGEKTMVFTTPKLFYASITNKLNEVIWQEYGIDDSTNYAQIVAAKNYLPIKVGDVIWKKNNTAIKQAIVGAMFPSKTLFPSNKLFPKGYGEIDYLDESTADYTVKGVADEGLNFDLFLLKRNV